MTHTWKRMQGCVGYRGIMTVGRELRWCRLTSEHHKALLYSQLRKQVNNVRMVVSPLLRRSGNRPTRIGFCSNTNGDRRFQCEDNNVVFTHVQPHLYCVRQVEPCHHLGWNSQALISSTLAVGALPKQQLQQQKLAIAALSGEKLIWASHLLSNSL